MRLPFKGTYRLSQAFGVNKDAYAKFGYLGHNGLDHAVPSGTDLFAMITGTVIEAQLDVNGYGWYVKIENDKEGALVGHMMSVAVKPGDKVVEGETFIGKSDNTGNSTGAHTHTGYFPKPRNRDNGYGGYIDFTNLLSGASMATVQVDSAKFEELVGKATKYDEFVVGGYTSAQMVTDTIKRILQDGVNQVTELNNKIKKMTEDAAKLQTSYDEHTDMLLDIQAALYVATNIAVSDEKTVLEALDAYYLKKEASTPHPQTGITGDSTLKQFINWLKGLFV